MHIIYLRLSKGLPKPIGRNRVPSDRYYDDFGLKFDYIKQDSLIPDYHYMTLRADSKQYFHRIFVRYPSITFRR